MRHLPRWLLFTAFVLILAIGAMSSLAVVTTRESFPQTNGRITVDALGSSAEVYRDAYGVPQIYADTPEDLFAAQGYVHAQDRFFEMDFRRHVTSGRLSELFGRSQLETDTYVRTLGWRRTAEQEARNLSGSTRRYLESYARGVNAWMQTRTGGELSLEYALLGISGGDPNYQPEPWTVADSLAWFKAMAWSLDANRLDEVDRTIATAAVGATRAAELWPGYDLERFEPIVTRGAVRNGAFDPRAPARGGNADPGPARAGTGMDADTVAPALRSLRRAEDTLAAVLGDNRSRLNGSNAYALSPRITGTGSAILAIDTHLATSAPATFAQVGLHCNVRNRACPFDVTGFSFAGAPGVIIGRNADIAWGMTTPYVDTQDVFVEQVRGNEVRYGNKFEPLSVRTEQVRVRGEDEPRTITIRSSRHGPLMSDIDPAMGRSAASPGGEPLPDGVQYQAALAWTATRPSTSAEALFALNAATDFATFRRAASLLTSPSQNLVYADRLGNIGYQLPGSLPVRSLGDGTEPRPGWDPRYDWRGTIPFAQLPWEYNPPSGYIVSANQTVIGPQYQPLLGKGASYGWRSQMIIDRLQQVKPVNPSNAADLFTDDTMGLAGDLVPTLLRVRVDDPWVGEGQRVLVGWDYRASADSAAAAYFSVVYKRLLQHTFGDEVPDLIDSGSNDRWFSVLSNLIKDPENPWWDDNRTAKVERRDDILLAALTDARKELTSRLSRDPSGWRWGALHTVTVKHQSLGQSGIAPVEAIFNTDTLPVGGSAGVINAMSWQTGRGDYTVINAPTMRMMIDFANLDGSLWINQTGASGHASHPHYDDQFPLWARGELIPMVRTRTAVEGRAVDRLELAPIG